jgi:hypothetical protein
VAGSDQHVGRDPRQRPAGDQADMYRPLPGSAQVGSDCGRCMAPIERADVGGLRGVQHVARGEHPGHSRAQRGIDPWTESPRMELAAGHHRKLVVRDPVGGEDHRVALDRPCPSRVEVGELDLLHPLRTVDRAQRSSRPDRCPESDRGSGSECPQGLVPGELGDQSRDRRSGVGEGRDRREADVLGADDHGAASDPLAPQVDELLERRSRHHPGRAIPGNQPSRARTLAASGGQEDAWRVDLLASSGAGQLQSPPIPVGDHRLREQIHARPGGELPVALRVPRPGEDCPQIAQAEAGVGGMTWNSACLALSIDHRHRGDAQMAQLDRRRKPSGPPADDNGPVSDRHRHLPPASR